MPATIGDLHQQQVLNNLAMFVANPEARPHFALPAGGQNQLTDTKRGSTTVDWMTDGFESAGLELGAERAANQYWDLQPINDPHKLTLMRCAYQLALQSSGRAEVSACCPDCVKRIREFYLGHAHEGEGPEGWAGLKCLTFAPNWFCVGTKKDVPKECGTLVGQYCDVYVWVPPHGRRELAKLTLAILDFAIYDPEPPPVREKQVTVYLTADGGPATPETAAKVVAANVPLTPPVRTRKDVEDLLLQTGPRQVTGGRSTRVV